MIDSDKWIYFVLYAILRYTPSLDLNIILIWQRKADNIMCVRASVQVQLKSEWKFASLTSENHQNKHNLTQFMCTFTQLLSCVRSAVLQHSSQMLRDANVCDMISVLTSMIQCCTHLLMMMIVRIVMCSCVENFSTNMYTNQIVKNDLNERVDKVTWACVCVCACVKQS